MKKILFEKLLLLSETEQAAFEIQFDRRTTVIVGQNDTGKSSLLKSIYWVLGADAAMVHPRWNEANVTGLLRFSINGDRYIAVRRGSRLALFDGEQRTIIVTSKLTSEYGPSLAGLLETKLLLTSRQGQPQIPPPAYLFLPFYIDQDLGWQQPWQSFSNLSQFANWKRDVILFHAGVKSNDYFRLKTELASHRIAQGEIVAEKHVLERASKSLRESAAVEGLMLDEVEYEDALHRLLAGMQALKEKRSSYASAMQLAVDRRVVLDEQLRIAKKALSELDKDVRWIDNRTEDAIQCPTCGTRHENSFSSRFGIIEDREKCRSFIIVLSDQIDGLIENIHSARANLAQVDVDINSLEEVLREKKAGVQLSDIIRAEGQRQALNIFDIQLNDLSHRQYDIGVIMSDLENSLDNIDNPKRKKLVNDFFAVSVSRNLKMLDVATIKLSDIQKMEKRVQDTGSDQPRAILAYFYAFLHTIEEFSSAISAPVIIDSPNQQDQDEVNASKMIRFIFDNQASGSQIIIGAVSLHGQEFEGVHVELKNKLRLLRPEMFDKVGAEMAPYVERMF